MTIAEAKRRLPIVQSLLASDLREPGLGEKRQRLDASHRADLLYEWTVLSRWLAPEHFRSGIGGWWHRTGCTLQREQNGIGAKCRQAKELVELLYPRPKPMDPTVPPQLERNYFQGNRKGAYSGTHEHPTVAPPPAQRERDAVDLGPDRVVGSGIVPPTRY